MLPPISNALWSNQEMMNKQMKSKPALFINNIGDARIQGPGFSQLFHLFHKYLLSTCFMPRSSFGAGDAAVSKTDEACPQGLTA